MRKSKRRHAKHQASMIVLGSSGKTAWVERWLGSTPQSIAEKSIYPTLLIPFEQKVKKSDSEANKQLSHIDTI